MWKIVILLTYLCSTTVATPVVGLKKNMEIIMADEIKREDMSKEKMSSSEKAEIAMTTLNLPSNATSIRADIVDGFSCKNREYGYYADIENDCQIFHVCMPVVYADGRENTFRWSFICPEETVFSQDSFTCMREEDMSFGCEESVKFYELNRNFGIIDSSMEVHSNEAETTSDIGMGDANMEDSMLERKPENQQKTMIKDDEEKVIEKIQKRVDEVKPEIRKPAKTHKKKNSLRKAPARKATTTTTVMPVTATEQVTPSSTLTTSLPLEIEITTAKLVEKLTTKYQRFTRRPETNKDNKKKVELPKIEHSKVELPKVDLPKVEISKPEPVTVGPIKEASKKPFKTESGLKRKRPHVPSSLKHKFNGEEKPLKNILKTSEIIKISPNQEPSVPNKINIKKDFIRPPIPEPILLKIEEQPALKPIEKPLKPEQIEKPVEPQKPLLQSEENKMPILPKPASPVPPVLVEPEMKNENEKILDTVKESVVTNEEPKNEEIMQENLKNKDNDLLITSLNDEKPNHVTDMKTENIPSQESIKLINEEQIQLPEKVEESLPSEKGEIIKENEENEEQHKVNSVDNKEEPNLNGNKQDNDDGSSVSHNQPIDQQSMIINLISSLVNAETSKVDDGADKTENSQFTVSGLLHSQQQQQQQQNTEQENLQPAIMDNTELHEQQEEQHEEKQQLNNNQLFELTTSNIISNDQMKDNDQKIENSEHAFTTTFLNKEGDNLNENKNENKKTELNQFDAMQKFIHQQHELYNHMTHIPVKLLTDDQFEDYKTKGDLSNSDALNVIQRIEQLLQDEVKDESLKSETNTNATPNEDKSSEPLTHGLESGNSKNEEGKTSSETQQSSEEIKPIYHRIFDPLNANLLKDNSMSVDENKPIVKDSEEPLKAETPVKETDSNLLKSDASTSEVLKDVKESATLETINKMEILKPKPENEEKLNSEPLLPVEVLDSKSKDEEIKEHNKVESTSSDILDKDLKTNSNLNDNKLNSVPSETQELESKLEKSPETLTEIKKLEEPTVSEQASDIIKTPSSRSLKFKTRIIDPRKRRFLFKADA